MPKGGGEARRSVLTSRPKGGVLTSGGVSRSVLKCAKRFIPAHRAGELLLGRRDLFVFDPRKKGLRALRPVDLGELLEVRDARYGTFEEALQPLDCFGDVRGGVVGDGTQKDRADVK